MSEKTVQIVERDGQYHLQNNGISDFALIGILECIIFDLKTTKRDQPKTEQKEPVIKQQETVEQLGENEPETSREAARETGAPDLRTRINNAVKAIRGLGGKVVDADLGELTDDQLQTELEELTSQYKRLKSSKATK